MCCLQQAENNWRAFTYVYCIWTKKGCIIVFGQDFTNMAIVLKLQPSQQQQLAHRESHGPSFFFLLHIGLFFVLPCIENYQKVDLRTITLDVPPQEVNVFRVKYLPLIETIAGKNLFHEPPYSYPPKFPGPNCLIPD